MARTVWTPQPRQAAMMARLEDEGFYGGAAGGGKSDYLIIEALRQVDKPWYRALILRKIIKELTQLAERAKLYYRAAYPEVKYNATNRVFTFPSGATITFDGLQYTKDKEKYQGQQYEFIGFDELTQFKQEEYDYLKSRNRANGPGMRTYMRATGNPGGIGHGWVKKYFVRAAAPGKTVWEKSTVTDPQGQEITFWSSRVFVPSSVFDNKILLQNDPDYLKKLATLNEADRNALLYGDWDSFSGQVFTEFTNDPAHYRDRRWTHVIADFEIPSNWQIIRSLDWGYTKPFSVGWHAVDGFGRYYRVKEYYGCQKNRPNTGVMMEAEEVAENIRQIEAHSINLRGRRILGVADPAIFAEQGTGSSTAALMAKHGVYFDKGDNARLSGKMQYHSRLAFDRDGLPMYQVFKSCVDYIRTIPNLVYSETHVEDIDTETEDHIYDESRYAIMMNMIAPRRNVMQDKQLFNPLDVDHDLMRYIL